MQPKKIVFIGASSVFGRMDPSGSGFAGRFKKWFESQDVKNVVFNLGISGDTTTGILKRLDSEASIRKPDLIIVQLGLNDTKRVDSKNNSTLTSFEQFKSNVKKITEKSSELADTIFLSVYPINDKNTTPMEGKNVFYLMDDAKKYSDATKEICEGNNVPYLNIFDDWVKRDYLKYIYSDGLHCNAEGHEEIFQRLKDFFIDLYSD